MRNKGMYMGVPEAALELAVSQRTIKRYIDAGYLDAGTLPGGALRLTRAQVLGCVKPLPRKEAQP
jgi:predicted site-specific integrase-resolvase